MLGSGVLDVAIGLVFVFLLVSLIVTAANEFIAALLSSRAKWLKTGILRLLGSEWALKLYEHPLIEGVSLGKSGPSYIASRSFSGALLDIVNGADKTLGIVNQTLPVALQTIALDSDRDAFIAHLLPALEAMSDAGGTAKTIADDIVNLVSRLPAEGFNAANATTAVKALLDGAGVKYVGSIIANIDDPRIHRVLNVLYGDAGGDFAKLKENIEIWFNNAMDRVGGWYKRKSQWVIASIALIVTLALNVDALLIVQHLNTQSALRDAVVAQAKAFTDTHTAPIQIPPDGDLAATSTKGASPEALVANARALDAQLDKLDLPIGWYRPSQAPGNESLATFRKANRLVLQTDDWLDTIGFHIVGWLLTAFAASLGAPFWFDTLNKFMSIRAAGKAPEERPKTPKEVPTPLEPGQSPREADAVGKRG